LAHWSAQARRSVEPLDWSGVVQHFEAELRDALLNPSVQLQSSQRCHESFAN
jgi:hypothetical protein